MQDTSLCPAGTSPDPTPPPPSQTEMAANSVLARELVSPAQRTEYFHNTIKDKDLTKDASTDKENNQSLVHPNSKLEIEVPDKNEDSRTITTKQTTDIRYSCPICEVVLFSSHDFTIHLRSHNSLLVKEDVPLMLEKGFMCPECGKVLGSASSLDRHILIHSGERPFLCRICGLSFTTNGNMHRHMRTHAICENGDYDSDASSDSLGSPKGLTPSSLINLKRRRISRTTSEFNNNVVETIPPVISGSDVMKRKSDSDDLHPNRKKKCDNKKSYVEKYDCQRCDKTGFPSSNLLEMHIEEFHPECKAKCEPCNLVFKNHRVLNLHRYMVHHAEIKEQFTSSKQETVGFKDLTFVDFSSEKFPHIARIMCEQSLHHASSLHHRFQCDKCSRAFPCGSALNIHRQGCGTENYASSGESCHQDNDLSSSDNEMPTDLSSGGNRHSWGESKVSESSEDLEEERKRSSYFFACLDLQNKSIPNTPTQIQPSVKDGSLKDSFFSYNNNNSEGKDLADIQSIISVTSTGGLLQDLSKSPQPTVLEVTPPDSGSRAGLFESSVTDEEQQDCFAAEFRKMKLRGEFPCRLCSAIFPNLRALKGHNRVHLSSNSGQSSVPYRCNMCPHFSTDKSALIRHMRTHNGDRPYECALCHYAFTTKANCERHLRNRHSKMTREEVKKSIIYHPSEDPTNEMENKPSRDDVKRSLFNEKEVSKQFENKEPIQSDNTSFTKTFVEKSPLTLETLTLQKPTVTNQIHILPFTPDVNKSEPSQIKCSDVGTMTYEENDSVHTYQKFIDSPTKSDSDGDTPLDLSMDVLDLSKKKNTIKKEEKVFDAVVRDEDTFPQDLSRKSNILEDKHIYPLTVEALEKSKSVQCPTSKYLQEVNTPTTSPSSIFDNQTPKSPNSEAIPKIDLTKLYPSSINPFFLNNNPTFTTFPGATAVTGPYPPYFIPPPAPILFSANPNQDLIEMKERLQKELIRGLQLTSGGSLVFDQITMASAADRLQALQHQAMAEINWRMENTKDERQLYSPSTNKEIHHSTTVEQEKEYSNQEHVQPKAVEKNSQTKPKQEISSSVKMVIKNGVLIPKQKQRRYRTERPFSCEHCSARFTLRSNMERHIKQQHPQFWTQRQRSGANIPTRRNNSLSGKIPQSLLNNGQFYPHSGISLYGAKSEDEMSRSSSTNDHTTAENKINMINDFNKTCISEEVKNAIAQQLKTKIPSSDVSQNEEENDDDLMDEEEDEDLVIDEEMKEGEIDEIKPEKNEKTEGLPIQKRYSMKDENQDLASVSRLLDNASTQTFRQYFHSDEDQAGEEGSEEDEEGLVAAGSTSEGCNSGSDENRSESENNIGANPAAVKKKSAYSLAPNRVSCPYCSRKFPWSSSLRRHVLTHTGQKPYKCSFCPLLFTTKSNCDRHLLRKHGGGTPAPCPDPHTATHNETSTNQNSANNYTMRNVPERPYKCKNCPSSTFSTLSNLKKHLSSKHHLSEKSDEQQSGYESQGSMSEEIDVGESEHCKNSLEMEIKEKPAISDPREIHPGHFVDNVHFYKTHALPVMLESNFVPTPVSTQASDLPFKCHLCEGSFGERQEALDHIRDNHCAEFQLLMSKGALEASASADDQQAQDEGGEECLEQLRGKFPDYANRKVMCAFCLRRFWSAEDLRRHMRTHTGERPFSCDICRRRFTLKHSMLRHRKKHAFPHNPAAEETSPVSDDDTNVPTASTNHNNNNVVAAKPWMKARLEEESDLISNLLGIQDKSIVDKMLLSKSADDAAKLLGVKK